MKSFLIVVIAWTLMWCLVNLSNLAEELRLDPRERPCTGFIAVLLSVRVSIVVWAASLLRQFL